MKDSVRYAFFNLRFSFFNSQLFSKASKKDALRTAEGVFIANSLCNYSPVFTVAIFEPSAAS